MRERVTHLTSALADETAGRREAERQLRGPCLKCGEMKHELEQANFQIEDLRAKVLQAERQVEDLLVMQREQQRLKESLPCALCADLRQQIDAKSREMELSRATLMSQRKELGDARKAQEESNSKLEEAWRTADAEHAERQHVNDILKKLLAEHDFTPASPQPHPSHRRNVTVRTGDQPHWQHQQSMRVNRSRAVPSWSSDEGLGQVRTLVEDRVRLHQVSCGHVWGCESLCVGLVLVVVWLSGCWCLGLVVFLLWWPRGVL